MDKKAIYNLSYGVFMVSTKAGEVANGCITNTCIQVASNPVRIAISVLNSNYTCDLIKESGIFAVSILDNDCTFETIKHFGFQSGRDVDKFENITPPTDCNDVPYLGWQSCAVISGKVVEQHDLGTHTLFIAEVVDAKVLSDKEPITYAKYQNEIKPKNNAKICKRRWQKLLVGDVRFAIMFMREVSCRKIMLVRYAVMEQMILSQYMKANCCAQR